MAPWMRSARFSRLVARGTTRGAGGVRAPAAVRWHVWCRSGRLLLEAVEMLLAELGHLGRDHQQAVGLEAVVPEILLVVLLGRVERLEWRHLGDDRARPDPIGVQPGDRLLGGCLLVGRVIEDSRTVLRARVRALPVQRRGIVDGEE